jgi:hypothetical protein
MRYARVTLKGDGNTYEDNVPNAVRSSTEAEVVFFYDEDDKIVGAFSEKIWLGTVFESDDQVDADPDHSETGFYDLYKDAMNRGFGNFMEALTEMNNKVRA